MCWRSRHRFADLCASTPGFRKHLHHRYPVKSCLGEEISRAEIVQEGVLGDRTFVVASKARALTQREEPLLSSVAARLTEGSLQMAAVDGSHDLLEVSSGDPGPTLQAPDSSARLFGDTVVGIDQGQEAAAWLSEVLGRRCRLLRRFAGCKRTAAGSHWADIAPLLVVSKASLQALAEATGKEIPADRFRPNVILDGPMEPHAEDTWDEMRIGPLRLQRLGPCARCAIVDVAQGQGKRDNAVYGPLVQHRGQAVFGQYYRPILAEGAPPSDRTLEVGTEVEIA
eukprot:s520_g13.t1